MVFLSYCRNLLCIICIISLNFSFLVKKNVWKDICIVIIFLLVLDSFFLRIFFDFLVNVENVFL